LLSKLKDFVVRSAFAASVLGVGVIPGFAVDIGHGEQLARRWCASCHIVADDQTVGADSVPTFAAIANDRISASTNSRASCAIRTQSCRICNSRRRNRPIFPLISRA